jgi:stress response protein SCP2
MIFDFYDNRNKYQRDMNNLRTSSPEMRQAYAQRFPVSNFAMRMGPTIAGAMTGIPLGLLERGFDKTKSGFDFLKSGAGKGLDSLVSGIDKGMGAVESGLDFLTGKASNVKDDAIDIFQDAIAKREEPNTFTVQNRPGSGDNFRKGFDSFLTDVPQQEVERLDPLANTKLSEPTGEYFDTSRGFPQMNAAFMPIIGETPEQTFARVTNRANFNEGGLASLNNRDYNMLMGASNFGF